MSKCSRNNNFCSNLITFNAQRRGPGIQLSCWQIILNTHKWDDTCVWDDTNTWID